MKFKKIFVAFMLTNALVLYLASLVAPGYVVFGNVNINPVSAVFLSAAIVTLIVTSVNPISAHFKLKFSNSAWMVLYLVANTGALYVITRTPVSEFTGMGVRAFWVTIILGIVVNMTQYFTWKKIDSK